MALEIVVTHGGKKKISATVGDFTVHTDQRPRAGGDGSAPEPYQLFLSSLATCAGIYVVGFCQSREIPTAGIRLIQNHDFEDGRLARVALTIEVPEDFPEKYREAVARAASACAVKKTLENPPEMLVETKVVGAASL